MLHTSLFKMVLSLPKYVSTCCRPKPRYNSNIRLYPLIKYSARDASHISYNAKIALKPPRRKFVKQHYPLCTTLATVPNTPPIFATKTP